MASSMEEALIEFFKKTTVSSAIVRRLAAIGEPAEHSVVIRDVNGMMAHLVPDYKFAGSASDVEASLHSFEPTVEKGLALLIDSGLVTESGSKCSLSEAGEELHRRITGQDV